VYFAEQKTIFGKWTPVTFDQKPNVDDWKKRGFLLRSVAEIDPNYRKLTLDQLGEIYGADGRFQSQARSV
jgi:hypothetical protein